MSKKLGSVTFRYQGLYQERFDQILELIVSQMTTAELMAIPGIYELLSEELNNDVLEWYLEESAE